MKKILVPIKRVPDTDQKIRVAEGGRGIVLEGMPFVMNPFDAIALEEALRMRESGESGLEVVAVGVGVPDYEKQLRTALAMGADRACLVDCKEALDPWNVARLLQAVVGRENPDLVLMGKQAVDDDANQTGQMLAALLGWPQATFASRIERGGTNDRWRVQRETDSGMETVLISLPAVITADLRLNEPRYASLPSIIKAKKKTIERLDDKELEVAIEPRVSILSLEPAPPRPPGRMLSGTAELVECLRREIKGA